MKVLALDISTKTGWAVLDVSEDRRTVSRVASGTHALLGPAKRSGFKYPWSYVASAEDFGTWAHETVRIHCPSVVIIEETNGGGRAGRYTQKLLEWFHYALLDKLNFDREFSGRVEYVNTGDWRRQLGLVLGKAEKRQNAALARARRAGKKLKDVRGRVTPKHLAVRWANATFGLQLIQKNNDEAEALALGTAWARGAPKCEGPI